MQQLVGRQGAQRWLFVAALCAGLLAGLGSGCGSGPASDGMVDGGSWYVREPWPHDGNPIESDNFVVYSDAASMEARRTVAERAERVLAEILLEMEIDADAMLRLPSDMDKIDIYTFETHFPEWSGKAYYGGLLIFSPNHWGRTLSGQTKPESYEATLEHELIHVVTVSLLHGRGLEQTSWVHDWFFEGWAEALSAGTAGGAIRGRDHLDYLISKYGRLNPVAYRDDQVEGGAGAFTEYFYPMRQLAVEYLLDEKGLGRTPPDGTALFLEMAGGADFEPAFEQHMGISVTDYQGKFFDLMSEYLPERSRSAAFGPVGLLLILAVSLGLAAAVSVRNVRRPAAAIPEGATATGATARLGRIGFGIWIMAVGTLSLGFYVLVVNGIGSSWSYTDPQRTAGILVMTGYLAACVAVLTWSMRRRRSQDRIAWLIPFLALGATPAAGYLLYRIL